MTILQRIQEVFSRYFPLHLNSTVEALEDDLAEAIFTGKCHAFHAELLKEKLDAAIKANNEYRKDNTYLESNLLQARQHIRVVQQELDSLYLDMTPKLDSWPVPPQVLLEEGAFGQSFLRVELPRLVLNTSVNDAIRKGLYPGYLGAFADQLADVARKEVKAAVVDVLKISLPK